MKTSMKIEFASSDISSMKYVPLTQIDVESSFSRYKLILRPNHRIFKFEILQMHIVFNFSKKIKMKMNN